MERGCAEMDIETLRQAHTDKALVEALYHGGHEDHRLTHSRAASVEFLTTMRVLGRYAEAGSRVIDLGAGTGVYTLPLAALGCGVDAVELSSDNARLLKEKAAGNAHIRVWEQSAVNLGRFSDEAYDLVLVFGPLYHLSDANERAQCIKEAMRVCKSDGTLFFAFINNDMVPLTECLYRDYFHPDTADSYDKETFQVDNFPFQFFTLDGMRKMLTDCGVQIEREIAADGVSELLADTINQMSDESFQNYLAYHFYCSEKPEMLGRSNHILMVGRKR